MTTNNYRIPEEYVRLIENDHSNKDLNRFSITKLLLPTRIAVLSETEDPIEDVSDSFPAFLGTCVHKYLEDNLPGVKEWKLVIPFEGKTIVGVIDRYDPETGTIVDYKLKKMGDSDYSQGIQQIKCYAWILRKMGVIANTGKVVAIRRDWSKMRGIPPIEEIEFPIHSSDIEEAEEWIKERIAAIEAGRLILPVCSDEEKWKAPDKWAVYKNEGDEKAKKLYDSEEEARATGLIVEHRSGKCLRCESFCPYSKVCRLKS